MKAQIIQLDSHDDYISTRDKMGWIQTGRIILVWPPRGKILNRKIDLLLVQRHSKSLGVTIAFVSSDSDVIYHAHQLGIPIFSNIRQALESPWIGKRRRSATIHRNRTPLDLVRLRERSPSHLEKSTTTPSIRIGAFIASLGALFAVISLFIPGANLTFSPVRKPQEIKILVTASPLITEVNLAGEIPARSLTTIVDGEDTISTTGSLEIPDQYALSGVRFTNLTEDIIEIPARTIVSTLGLDPIRFETTKAGEISGGIGKSITLPVKALIAGVLGNVPAESILAIEGPLGLTLSVINPMPAHSGSQKVVPAASSKDISTLHIKIRNGLEKAALNELKLQLNPDDLLISESLTAGTIIDESYDPVKNQPANQLTIRLQIEFEILYIDRKDLNYLANLVLDTNLPDGYIAMQDTMDIQPMNQAKISTDEVIQWQMTFQRDIIANINPGQAINMVLGLPVSQAKLRLEDSFDLIHPPKINLTPNWWPRMPFLPFRFQVNNTESP